MNQVSQAVIRQIAAAIVVGMVREAAYRGVETDAGQIAQVIQDDPDGETAAYFRRAAAGSLDWLAAFRADPDLLDAFAGASA